MSYPSQFLSRFILPKSRYEFALKRKDFRVNFALNSGSLSSPSGAVPVYKPASIEQQLEKITGSFLNWSVSVKQKGPRDATVSLPRACQWFAEDFGDGSANDILNIVNRYLRGEKRDALRSLWREEKNWASFFRVPKS